MRLVLLLTSLTVLGPFAWASTHSHMPHFDLQMTSQELEKALQQQVLNRDSLKFQQQEQLEPMSQLHRRIIEMGRVNLEWLELINSERDTPIILYHPGELRGIPIDSPMSYGPSTIEKRFSDLSEQLPTEMKAVLMGGKSATPDLPTDEVEEYRTFARRVDGMYGITLRWEMMKRWLSYLSGRRAEDIRGYHFLSKKENLREFLQGFSELPEEEQNNVRLWLRTLCYNSSQFGSERHFEQCRREAEEYLTSGEAYQFSQRYWSQARSRYEAFFKIPSRVKNASTQKLTRGFVSKFRTAPTEIQEFLKTHIEDEFNLGDFNLEVQFTGGQFAGVFVEWLPDVTPHVKGLGSDHIVMNSRDSLDDWNTQWTIRHEFGHVHGLPDCYIEFYEADKGVITNYQIDVEDLMCSRAGVMNQRIADELNQAYQ